MKAISLNAVVAALLTAAAVGLTFGRPPIPQTPVATPATPATATAQASAPAIPLDPYTKDLLTRLNSTDAAQREAAEKQLANIAGLMQQPEALKKLQEVTTDPDLKEFFVQRQAQIRAHEEERRLSNLPNITLKLSNASLAQTAAELNKAMGNPPMSFVVENNGDQSTFYTIDVKDKPFWEVFAQLQESGGFEIQNYGGNQPPRLYPNNNRYQRKYIVNGPVMAVATGINYQRNVSFQGNNSVSSNLNVNFTFYVDPRIRSTRFKNPTNVKLTDDQGQSIPNNNNGGGYNTGQSNMYSQGIYIQPPPTLPKSITVSFDAGVTTTVGDTKVTVDDITKNNDKVLTLGNRTLRIVNVTGLDQPGRNNAMVQMEVQAINDGSGMDYNSRIPFSIIDANNKVLLSSSFNYGGMNFNFNTNNSQGPYKLEVSSPGRNFDIPVHFEFKDLQMP